jgi:hypothetical protein
MLYTEQVGASFPSLLPWLQMYRSGQPWTGMDTGVMSQTSSHIPDKPWGRDERPQGAF